MGATSPAPADPVDKDDFPPLSKGAAVFVMFVACVGAILATIDVFINGWLAALAHVGWFLGVFLVISLVLGLLIALVVGGRQAVPGEVPASTP
ncbi:hypothetical protein [Streptomyces yangpuensis]|uniref:hypothetical protein n=1 Tax=Streptomyces yangpuensis TaxID=1648182 RepID=UPI0036513771